MYKPEKSQNEIIAENLTQLLRTKGISQNQLAQKISVSATSVNAWCRGITAPRNDKIEKICQVLNVQRSDLMTDKSAVPNLSVPAAHPLPILGRICAGDGILAEQNFDGYFFVDNSIRANYCLRIEGDSMKDANIFHGDIAFLRTSYDFINGGIYAVVFGDDDNAVLKKVYRQGDGLLLMPCNQMYDPIYVDDALIVGECVGVYHPRSNV